MRDRNALLALAVGCLLALGIIFGGKVIDSTPRCAQVNRLSSALVTILQNGEQAAPNNPYFQEHPDQLRLAQQQYSYDVQQIQKARC